MKKTPALAAALCAALSLSGCKTTGMSRIQNIDVPEGYTTAEVVKAILLSADPDKPPAERRLVIPNYGRWRVEDSSVDRVVLGFQIDHHYMRVEYKVDGRVIVPRVVESRNLNQSRTRIHRKAVVWINRSGASIRAALWQVKQQREGP